MDALFYVVAILGCGDGNAPCTQARLVPTRYETLAQCRAALPQQIAMNTDLAFPSIGADCRATGTRVAKAEGAKRQG
ncbi:hypothetical protein [Sphingomonas rubra]|uniref:Uncharacterized protein n=1 Tax=Sphingomonas rubra TaxID=634430 RepID=A0A1I5TKA7_9SPHN|nr:hypothetical protein [Sphingomonas rubra]SFP83311.1 hypothetical protein SAMN04488241_10892 [Sphingomonas rubra]